MASLHCGQRGRWPGRASHCKKQGLQCEWPHKAVIGLVLGLLQKAHSICVAVGAALQRAHAKVLRAVHHRGALGVHWQGKFIEKKTDVCFFHVCGAH